MFMDLKVSNVHTLGALTVRKIAAATLIQIVGSEALKKMCVCVCVCQSDAAFAAYIP